MLTRKIFSVSTRLVLLAISIKCTTIHLKINANDKCEEDQTRFILYEGDPLNLEIVGFDLKHAWCQNFNLNANQESFKSKINVIGNTIKIQNVTRDMSTRWKCTLLRGRSPTENTRPYPYIRMNYTAAECLRLMHVRSKNVLSITTQGEVMEMNVTDSSILDYDAVAFYNYQEGEIVNTDCVHNQTMGGLDIAYYDANDTMLFRSDVMYNNNKLIFRSYMTADRNGSHFDCHYTPTIEQDNIVYRIYFILNQRIKDSSIVSVNGLELVYSPKEHSTAVPNYLYYYIDGEQLELFCGARDRHQGTKSDVIESHLNERFRGFDLTKRCGTSNNPVDITFTSDLLFERPRITGLQLRNILYEYTSAMNEWTIYYHYNNSESLNLNCVKKIIGYYDDLQWISNNRTLYSRTPVIDQDYSIKTINRMFALKDANEDTFIQCQVTGKDANSKLYVKSSVILKLRKRTQIDQGTKGADGLLVDDGDRSKWWIIGGASGFVLFVTIALCGFFVFWLRKKTSSTENDYCEISEQEDAPIPSFPSQWNDYVENDSHYTKIDEDVMVVNQYYHPLNKMHRNETVEVPLYAEITPKNGSELVYDYAYGILKKPTPVYCNTHSDMKSRPVYENSFNH